MPKKSLRNKKISRKSNKKISRKSNKKIPRKYKYSFGEGNKKELLIYFIAGLGCKYAEDELNEFRDDIARDAKIDRNDVKIICHDKHFAPIRGIFSSFLQERFDTTPMKNSSFLRRLEEDVLTQSKLYEKILIFGHSYGGLIANRLAEELNKMRASDIPDIEIATFGSIYVAKPKNVDLINIVNYQSIGDISNRFKENDVSYNDLTLHIKGINSDMISFTKKDSHNVIYICVSTPENPKCEIREKGFFWSDDEWEIHNNYFDLITILSYLQSNIVKLISS